MNTQTVTAGPAAPVVTIGAHIPASALPKYTDFRTLYPLHEGDGVTAPVELVGFVGMKKGWGRSWQLFALRLTPPGASLDFNGVQPDESFTLYGDKKEGAIDQLKRLREMHPGKLLSRTQLMNARVTQADKEIIAARSFLQMLETSLYQAREEARVLASIADKVKYEFIGTRTGDWVVLEVMLKRIDANVPHCEKEVARQAEFIAKLEAKRAAL